MTLSILKYNLTIGLLISTHILFAQVKKNEQPPVEKNNKKKEQVKGFGRSYFLEKWNMFVQAFKGHLLNKKLNKF